MACGYTSKRESGKKEKWSISDNFGLRSPVIREPFQAKSANASIVARVSLSQKKVPGIPYRLSFSGVEPSISTTILRSCFVLGLAHGCVSPVARTNERLRRHVYVG